MLSDKSPGILATTMAPKPLSSSDFPSHQQLPSANRRRTTIRSFTGFLVFLLLWQLWSFSSRVEEPTSDNHSSTLQPSSSSSHLSPSTPSSTPATPNDCPPAPALSSLFIVLQTPPNTTHSSATAAAAAAKQQQQQQQQEALSETHYATTLRCIPHYGVFTSGTTESLASRALASAPASATWFVFLDASTHVLWPNLLAYLAHFSSPAADSWYLGEPSLVGAHVVANAGAGTVVSRGAMRRIASGQHPQEDDDEDVMVELGKTLVKAGVELTWAWPGMQGGAPSALEWGGEREGVGRLWCHRAVSYGGLTGEELEVLDVAEREARAAVSFLFSHPLTFADLLGDRARRSRATATSSRILCWRSWPRACRAGTTARAARRSGS